MAWTNELTSNGNGMLRGVPAHGIAPPAASIPNACNTLPFAIQPALSLANLPSRWVGESDERCPGR
jgi:hypothetical protein